MVTVIESSIVVPSVETPKHGLWVSNLDLLAPRAYTPTVYFYRPNGNPDFFVAKTLKNALSKALVPFYPFAGRLGFDRDRRIEIKCNGEGALFIEAKEESTIDEYGDFTPSLKMRESLVPRVDSGDGYPPCPLLLIQVTSFRCGGVCLGVGVHHTVSDGAASLHFINAWSDIARGLDAEVRPFLDRTILRARKPPTILFDHAEYNLNPQTKPSSIDSKPFSSAIFTISREQLALIKKKNNNDDKELGTISYSTYETLAAHVWRCACKARGLNSSQETRVYITADARNRLRPPLPPGYLGNAIFTSSAVAVVGDVRGKPLGHAASKIRQAIARLDDEYLRSSLDFLELQDDLECLRRGSGTFPSTDLSIVCWTSLPIHEADFGYGRPVFMGPASFFYGGLAYIMPNASKDGGISLALSLESEHMRQFSKLFYELENVDECY